VLNEDVGVKVHVISALASEPAKVVILGQVAVLHHTYTEMVVVQALLFVSFVLVEMLRVLLADSDKHITVNHHEARANLRHDVQSAFLPLDAVANG
jgi:hypothetical protein